MTNPIKEYYQLIESKKVTVSKKVKIQYKYLVWLIDNSDTWVFDEMKSNKAIDFIENFCKHSKGSMAGKPFILELWQKAYVASIFGIVHKDTGKRKHKRATLIVSRKNGKSTLMSAISLFMLIADGEGGAEIYSVATKRDQAKIVWNESKRMIQKSAVLRKNTKSRVGDILCGDSSFLPLGRDSDTLDGLNVHCATFDEIHAWKDQNLYDVVVDGTAARDNYLILVITTAGTVRENVYDRLYAEGKYHIDNIANCESEGFEEAIEELLFVAYELDSRNEWEDPKCWQKANPSLYSIIAEDYIAKKVKSAQRDSSRLKNLLTKHFNIPDTDTDVWLSLEDIVNENTFVLKSEEPDNEMAIEARYGIGGFDLSNTTDLTCATILFRVPQDDTIYVRQMYWIPEDLIETRVQVDKVPYDHWQKLGLLRTCEGNKINHKDVYNWFLEVQEELDIYIFKIGYDRWHASFLVEELKQYFGQDSLVDIAQGTKTLSSPMFALGADIKSKKVNYNNNQILRWCMTNVNVKEDVNGNIQPQKTQNANRRIDGFASLLNAYVVYQNEYENYMSYI